MSDKIDAYPLQWPTGWPRTQRRLRSSFDTTSAKARDALYHELRLMGVRQATIVVSSNAVLNRNGELSARQPRIDDPGVAVYFMRGTDQKCIPCDKWDRIEDNVQAIVKTVNALRGLERWGAKSMVDAAFQGFQALPETIVTGWWSVLGVTPDASMDDINAAYRSGLRTHHPDAGGDHESFLEFREAYDQAVKARQ